MKTTLVAAGAIALSLSLAACGSDSKAATTTAAPTTTAMSATTMAPTTSAMTGTTAPMASGDIVAIASGNADFSTLVAAVKAAGLVDTLKGTGPFTVFAPTNEAFAALPAGVVDKLLKPENKAVLVKILTYHVVAGKVMAADVKAGDVPSVEGSAIKVAIDGGTVTLNGSAKVVTTDIAASNGVIHVIDAVIIPPDVDVTKL